MRWLAPILVVAAACHHQAAPRPVDDSPPAPGVVKLVDAGKSPRARLHYKFTPGTHQTVTLKQTTAIADTPPTTATMTQEIDVISVGADGAGHLEGMISQMTAPNGADASKLKDHKLRLTMSADGKVTAEGDDLQQVGQLGMAFPLPAEPVGVGARWRYVTQVSLGGMKMEESNSYELKSVDGDRLVIAQTIEPKLDAPELGAKLSPGGTMDLDGSGTGELQIDLGKPIPTTSMTMNLGFTVKADGKSTRGKMTMTLEMHGT